MVELVGDDDQETRGNVFFVLLDVFNDIWRRKDEKARQAQRYSEGRCKYTKIRLNNVSI